MSCNLTIYETKSSLEKEMQCDIRLLHDLHTFLLPHIIFIFFNVTICMKCIFDNFMYVCVAFFLLSLHSLLLSLNPHPHPLPSLSITFRPCCFVLWLTEFILGKMCLIPATNMLFSYPQVLQTSLPTMQELSPNSLRFMFWLVFIAKAFQVTSQGIFFFG